MAVAVLRDLFRQREKIASEASEIRVSVRITLSDFRTATMLNRKRFAEVKKALIEKGLITISGNFVSLLEASETSESVRNGQNRTPDPLPSETSGVSIDTGRTDAPDGQNPGGTMPDDEGGNYEEF